MATGGGVTLTEDDLSCDICFEVYRNPQALRCLHTFCRQCINRLVRSQQVECPQCREVTNITDVRNDFKTQTLVDKHNRKRLVPSAPVELTCGMCQREGQMLQLYCLECEKVMCTPCHSIHQGISACAGHTVKSIPELKESLKWKLKITIDMLEKENDRLMGDMRSVETSTMNIHEEEGKKMREVDDEIEKEIEKLNKKREKMQNKILQTNKGKLEKLAKKKDAYLLSSEEIQGQIAMVMDVMNEEDVEILKNMSHRVSESATTQIQIIKERLNVDGKTNSSETAKGGECCDPVLKAELKSSQLSTDYSTIANNTYVSTIVIHTKRDVAKMRMINGKLFCACGEKGIKIYSQDCELLDTISRKELRTVTGVAQFGARDIVVSTRDTGDKLAGLHHLTQDGDYKGLLVAGNFSDVCVYKDIVYGLDEKCKVILYEHTGHSWKACGVTHELAFSSGDNQDKLHVNAQGIYVSSWDKHCLQVYNHEGELFKQTDTKYRGSLCDVDDHGYALLASMIDCKLQVLSPEEDTLMDVALKGDSYSIFSAVVGDRGETLWLGTAPVISRPKLIKYVKRD